MFGLDASKKKFNKVWNQRRAASARVAKVSSASSSNAASTSTSNSTSNPPQQRSASFRYRRSEGSTRAARTGHSSDFDDDDDDDDDQFTFTRSSFTRHGSNKASFKSHNRSTGSISLHQPSARSEPFGQQGTSKATLASDRAKLLAKAPALAPLPSQSQPLQPPSGSISPSNRHSGKEGLQRPSDVPLSSVVSTSPVTPRYPVAVGYDGSFYKEHYSNYEWIDANGLIVSPPDPTLVSCAPCKDVSNSHPICQFVHLPICTFDRVHCHEQMLLLRPSCPLCLAVFYFALSSTRVDVLSTYEHEQCYSLSLSLSLSLSGRCNSKCQLANVNWQREIEKGQEPRAKENTKALTVVD